MIRRLRIDWPDARPFVARDGRTIRWLAVSDDEERGFDYERNRDELGAIDAVIGAGDLQPDYLGFLADAFQTRLAYVRGNHDQGGRWAQSVETQASAALPTGSIETLDGIPILALEWPGVRHRDRRRHDPSATSDVIRLTSALTVRRLLGRAAPFVVLSHAPPKGVGDCDGVDDPFHAGFGAYRWLLDRLQPPLWLHGHTHPAAAGPWRIDHRGSQVVNVTGAVLVEIAPPERRGEARASR